jgi:hypothetical protein
MVTQSSIRLIVVLDAVYMNLAAVTVVLQHKAANCGMHISPVLTVFAQWRGIVPRG